MVDRATTTGDGFTPLYSEIFRMINNAKDKPKKLEILQKYDTPSLRMVCKAAFDPNIVFLLPAGTPPYEPNGAPEGTEHTLLANEVKRLYHFIKGGNDTLPAFKREQMFVQMLEGLHSTEATLLIDVKEKRLNKVYKGLTENLVKEAFNWNDSFAKIEQK